MDRHHMSELARGLAVAKSRQDVPAAMALLHRDMVLETPAFGATARGASENEKALRWFFAAFPDYQVDLDGQAADRTTLTCWGTARMTMTGGSLGVTPNGRRAELPVVVRFGFEDCLIRWEWFLFDLAELCAQSGVSADAVRGRFFGRVRA